MRLISPAAENLEERHTQVRQQSSCKYYVLDILLTYIPEQIQNTAVVNGISDHKAVIIDFDINMKRYKKPKRKAYLYSRTDFEGICDKLNSDFPVHETQARCFNTEGTTNLFV